MGAERVDETRSCVGAPSRLRERRRRDRWKGAGEWNKEGEREACVGLCTWTRRGSCRRSAQVSFGRRYGTLEA